MELRFFCLIALSFFNVIGLLFLRTVSSGVEIGDDPCSTNHNECCFNANLTTDYCKCYIVTNGRKLY
ncbi:hypothetical protein JTE90_008299 [Oedothorax gibbosus]|uniref:Late nodulin n=1 Tax=Oedothorax gibbosus TaxID=931172 RepID=A0AAV6UG95_9ARAC|nr:hypothetical protein JTE90_008299 [Oedothorax gibbosus]